MTSHRTRLIAAMAGGDDGVSAILVCLIIVFLVIPVAAVSVDLSNAYSNRRQMQNAADAASQAGAEVMNEVRLNQVTSNFGQLLDTTVKKVAEANSSSDYSCNVATVSYASSGPTITAGPTCSSWSGDVTNYNAVTVHTHRTVGTFFARAILSTGGDNASTSAQAIATATIQKVSNPYVGLSPFAMCASAYTKVKGTEVVDPSVPSLLVPDLDNPVPGSSPQTYYYKLNTDAVGTKYAVWSNGGGSSDVSDCGLASQNFNGLVCGMYEPSWDSTNTCSQPIVLPDDPPVGANLSITNGAVVGPTLATYAGYQGCNPNDLDVSGSVKKVDFTPCGMALPICDSLSNAAGSIPALLHCITFGLFLLAPGVQHSPDASGSTCDQTSNISEDTICAEFVGDASQVLNGTPETGDPGANDPVRIALVQ